MQLWQILACTGASLATVVFALWLIGDRMARIDKAHDDSWGDWTS